MRLAVIVTCVVFAGAIAFQFTALYAATIKARTWTDTSGRFSVRAEFVDSVSGNVTLRRVDNGKTVTVPFERLSLKDREHVKTLLVTEEQNPQTLVVEQLNSSHLRVTPTAGTTPRDYLVIVHLATKNRRPKDLIRLPDGDLNGAVGSLATKVKNNQHTPVAATKNLRIGRHLYDLFVARTQATGIGAYAVMRSMQRTRVIGTCVTYLGLPDWTDDQSGDLIVSLPSIQYIPRTGEMFVAIVSKDNAILADASIGLHVVPATEVTRQDLDGLWVCPPATDYGSVDLKVLANQDLALFVAWETRTPEKIESYEADAIRLREEFGNTVTIGSHRSDRYGLTECRFSGSGFEFEGSMGDGKATLLADKNTLLVSFEDEEGELEDDLVFTYYRAARK